MAMADQISAIWGDFLKQGQSHSELFCSLSVYSALEADDMLLETTEIMVHSENLVLHNGPALRLGLV